MSRLNIAPTKSNQMNLKRDLDMASEGFTLLEQKREILVMELMRLLNQVKQVQSELSGRRKQAYATLRRAVAQNGQAQMRMIASGIQYKHVIRTGQRVTAGVRTPLIEVQQGQFSAQYGFVGTDSLVDQTMKDFLALLEIIGQVAELENTIILLARELKKAQRRVNALEHIFIPDFKETLRFIAEVLEGKELDAFFTLKMVKKNLEKQVRQANLG
ncbi:MAG: V-type ATP synthase subunit D [Lentisphaeria bacterium]|jgi:V/A-type H+-transporting ATPase subunit D|nr:V-type ATP synthase subunit D [Lentisphaeria bacterium]MDY0176364.1 V-type ATP synthase subunit D [Lentisphaeria bacterium]NLZ59404.1 V-type ATP synthase subunit D [Lentisphaerota bacterium]